MKRHILFLLAAVLGMLNIQPAIAQQTQDALYIFRNDGGFHGFFYWEIDHIAYSKIDTLGEEQPDYVVQEVYARDTVYRIPVSAIDSVAFVTPENVVKSDVAYTTDADIWNYVIKSDTLYTFVLSPQTPSSMIPKVGDKMVKTEATPYMPHGVYATVESIENNSDGITVVCAPTPIGDLFDQFTSKIAVASKDPTESSSRRRGEELYEEYGVGTGIHERWTIGDFLNLVSVGAGVGGSVIFTGAGQVKLDITPTNQIYAFYSSSFVTGELIDIHIRSKILTEHEFSYTGAVTVRQDLALPPLKVPLGTTPFVWQAQFGLSASLSGSLTYQHKIHDLSRFTVDYTYCNRYPLFMNTGTVLASYLDGETRHEASGSYTNIEHKSSVKLLGKITAQLGVFASFGVSLVGETVANCTYRGDIGKRASFESDWDSDAEMTIPAILTDNSTHFYDLLNKDNSIKVSNYAIGKVIGSIGPKSWKLGKSVTVQNGEFGTPFEGSLVPKFSNISFKVDEKTNQATASANIERPVLFGVPIGFALYNAKTKKIIGKPAWYDKTYSSTLGTPAFTSYKLNFKGIEGGQTVRVFPIVRIEDNISRELLATPYKDFEIEPVMYFFTGDKKYNTMTFDYEEYTKDMTLKRNFSQPNKTFKTKTRYETYGKDKDQWIGLRNSVWDNVGKDGIYIDEYKLTMTENKWDIDRHAEIDLIYENEKGEFEVMQTIYITQEKRDYYQLFGVWQKVGMGYARKYYFNSDYTFKLTQMDAEGNENVVEEGKYTLPEYKEQENTTFNYKEFYGTIKDSMGRTREFYSAKYANDDRIYLILDNESYFKVN